MTLTPLPMEAESREREAQLGSPGSALSLSHSPPLSSSLLFGCQRSIKARRINDYLHLTKLEESKFPSARRREGSGGIEALTD